MEKDRPGGHTRPANRETTELAWTVMIALLNRYYGRHYKTTGEEIGQ